MSQCLLPPHPLNTPLPVNQAVQLWQTKVRPLEVHTTLLKAGMTAVESNRQHVSKHIAELQNKRIRNVATFCVN